NKGAATDTIPTVVAETRKLRRSFFVRSVFMARPPGDRFLTLPTFPLQSLERFVLILDDLGHQLAEFLSGLRKHFAPLSRGPVVFSPLSSDHFRLAAEVAMFLEQMQ